MSESVPFEAPENATEMENLPASSSASKITDAGNHPDDDLEARKKKKLELNRIASRVRTRISNAMPQCPKENVILRIKPTFAPPSYMKEVFAYVFT